MQITAIKKLLRALDDVGAHSTVMEEQMIRTRDRLNAGVDVDGRPFAPYKTRRPYNHTRPLLHAAQLFDPVKYDGTRSAVGFELKASIFGQAARIAYYQNFRRKFLGFSREDRRQVRDDLADALSNYMQNQRWR